MMLAEEILRAELRKLYGDETKIFQCDVIATPIVNTAIGGVRSLTEVGFLDAAKERYISIVAVIGPFEREYPANPPEDKRRKIRRLEARTRLFSIEGGATFWRPHFMRLELFSDSAPSVFRWYCYEDGFVDEHPDFFVRMHKSDKNPCEDMVDSQIQPDYSQMRHSNVGRD